MEHILFEKEDHIARITLNRPEHRNAYTSTMSNEMSEALRMCDRDPQVRVVIITGAGDAFCVGLDMNDMRDDNIDEFIERGDSGPTQRVMRTYPFQIKKPVICAINGAAGGFGAAFPLTCDIRLAAEDAPIAYSFVKWGLVPEMGSTWLMPRLIGQEKTADLLLTGRKITGKEAAEIGLVLRAVPKENLLEEATKLATEIAQGSSPTAVSVVKQMTWGRLMEDGELYRAIYEDDDAIAWALAGPDAQEGNKAFFERRPANWSLVDPNTLPKFGKKNANPFGNG